MRIRKIVSILLCAAGLANGIPEPASAESSTKPRIVSIDAIDDGSMSNATTSIDVDQGICGTGTSATAEPFFDTLLQIKVINPSNSEIVFTRFTYSIHNFDGSGAQLNAVPLAPVGSGRVPTGNDGTVLTTLFLRAENGQKFYTRKPTPIPITSGFKNVTVRLEGRTARGKKVTISARTALHLGSFDRCSS